MKRAAIVLLLLAVPVFAETLHISWTPPPTRTNGEALAPSEIRNYSLYWTCDTGAQGSIDIPAPQTSIDYETDFYGRCYLAMSATDTDGNKGPLSAPVNVFIKLPTITNGGFE